jgi:hypothetical protein
MGPLLRARSGHMENVLDRLGVAGEAAEALNDRFPDPISTRKEILTEAMKESTYVHECIK